MTLGRAYRLTLRGWPARRRRRTPRLPTTPGTATSRLLACARSPTAKALSGAGSAIIPDIGPRRGTRRPSSAVGDSAAMPVHRAYPPRTCEDDRQGRMSCRVFQPRSRGLDLASSFCQGCLLSQAIRRSMKRTPPARPKLAIAATTRAIAITFSWVRRSRAIPAAASGRPPPRPPCAVGSRRSRRHGHAPHHERARHLSHIPETWVLAMNIAVAGRVKLSRLLDQLKALFSFR
jgi:hypothetical protein